MQTLSMLLISSKQGETGRGKGEGNNFLLLPLLLFFFLVCETAFKGIVYPLAVKSTQVLDLAHQKERIALV